MKKIFLLIAAVCALAACDPTHEDISNDGHITLDELVKMSSVTTDKAPDGKNGNVITCRTSAPVNAKWTIDGKDFLSNYATKKMFVGDYTVTLTALCPDGTVLKNDYQVSCEKITQELKKVYIYGENPTEQPPFTLRTCQAGDGRFSDTEGAYLPYLSDEVYFGLKTLVFDIIDVQEGENPNWGMPWGPAIMRVMTGWWSTQFMDDFEPKVGLWELPITQQMADWCAHSNKPVDGESRSRDLTLMMTRGTATIKCVYYEE
ncbi:MAG: hypothetical protein J6O49_10510 [Bacteroidaceae bacterium]|nr:hypothetical protein [Bacteroidaceae bacterium]